MKSLRLFLIDAFADRQFEGNPAAVCLLDEWIADSTLQNIAAENNLSETAFFVPDKGRIALRWFTPRSEVDLCGHATLASAFVVLRKLEPQRLSVLFTTRSGDLRVDLDGDLLRMDFPALSLTESTEPPNALRTGLGREPSEIFEVTSDPNYYCIFEDERSVLALRPDLGTIEELHPYGVVATSPGRKSDCSSRYFAPSYGILEDPVTGSIHCALVPFWSSRLGKNEIFARQVSSRGGELFCENRDGRVRIAGRAVLYSEGTILLQEN